MQFKSIFPSCLLVVLYCVNSFADTYVEGDVYGEWTTAGSPYIVQEDCQVPAGQTLNIEPGVEVRFLRDDPYDPYEIAVYGTLYAVGEPLSVITFLGNAPACQPDHWDGIKFVTEEAGQSEISNCDIQHANYGIYISNSSPLISYNDIHLGSSDGVVIYGTSSPVISYNLIRNYEYRGIKVEDNASPQIFNNTIVFNGSYGMYLTDTCSPSIYNNIVCNNYSYGIRALTSVNANLSYNDVYDNSSGNYYGITAGPGSISADPDFVSSASGDFHLQVWSPCIDAGDPASPLDPDGTRADMGAFYFYQAPAAPIIISIPDTTAVSNFYYSYDVEATGVPDPTFSLSVMPAGMTIDVASGLITWTPDDSQVGENNVTVTAASTSGQDDQSFTIDVELNLPPVITAHSPVSLDTTVEFGESVEFNIIIEEPNSQTTTTVWYENDVQAGIGEVIIIPFSQTGQNSVKVVVTDGVLSDSLTWSVFVPGTSLEGNLSGLLAAGGNPYYMIDDVEVLEGASLTIEPGVEIRILRPSTINSLSFGVYGQLNADGTEENPIIFTPQVENAALDHWTGILFYSVSDPNSSLTYCEIDHAYKGIDIEGASPTISQCNIKSCSARGISISDDGAPSIHHNLIWLSNTRGLYCYNASPEILNNTIVSNTGSGIYISGTDSEPLIQNNISCYNSQIGIFVSFSSSPSVNYNDAYGNSVANYSGTSMGSGGLAADPQMENYLNGQFELTTGSPCIDAGDPYGALDPDGTFAEMGRYYFEQSPAIPAFSSEPDTMNIAGFSYSYNPVISGVPWPSLSLLSSPPGMTMDPLFGDISYQAAPGDTGAYAVDIAATNSQGTTNHTWTLHVNLNQPPVIPDYWPLEIDTVGYHVEIDFGVYALDPDSHAVTYDWQLNGTPVGSGTPELSIISEAFGDNEVRVSVSDGVDETFHVWNFFIRGSTINGSVSGTWNWYDSPYVAYSNIVVEPEDSLIIDAGVHVYFAGNYTFTVHGYLEIN